MDDPDLALVADLLARGQLGTIGEGVVVEHLAGEWEEIAALLHDYALLPLAQLGTDGSEDLPT